MIFVNDKKYACETCIKGHRSSSCQHTERALFEIKKKGRPVTQCDHCRELRKTKQVHVRCSCDARPETGAKLPGKKGSRLPAEAAYPHGLPQCGCGEGQSCSCCAARKKTPSHPHAYAPYARPMRIAYRIGPCACATLCPCPECADHRAKPHLHAAQPQPLQGHGGDPCPVRCPSCVDCYASYDDVALDCAVPDCVPDCACPPGHCVCTWDRPRCSFATSTERASDMDTAGDDMVSDDMVSDVVGSDAGDASNLSIDFADLNFGLVPVPYGDLYQYDSLNHSNLSLGSSIDSASVSLASLASSHGISSLSSHVASGRLTPSSGRLTPVRQPIQMPGKPTPRGYRRILPKVAAMTNHRPFRRLHPQQPSLHAVMESDVPALTSPPPSQVLLHPQPQYVQPRIRRSVRSHLPIVGKYFAPGGRYEPSRFRNAAAAAAAAAQQQQQFQPQAQPQAYAQPQEALGSFCEEEEDMYQEQQRQAQYAMDALGQYGGAEPAPFPIRAPVSVVGPYMATSAYPMDIIDTPPSPRRLGSGVPMPHTMSLPTAAPMSRTSTHHPYDDTDIKPPDQPDMREAAKKSRWPSFSVHGHRVVVGAKVMGAAYASRS